MCHGYDNIFHFLCKRVLLQTEPHCPWNDLPFTTQIFTHIVYKATQQDLQLL